MLNEIDLFTLIEWTPHGLSKLIGQHNFMIFVSHIISTTPAAAATTTGLEKGVMRSNSSKIGAKNSNNNSLKLY
jgi:hypothetical protein